MFSYDNNGSAFPLYLLITESNLFLASIINIRSINYYEKNFTIQINAPVEKVWRTMLDKPTYSEWTAMFMEGSDYSGSWEKGSKIKFASPNENGKLSGMSSEIVENKLHEYISIHHLGMIMDDVEDTTSPEALKWTGYENYSFKKISDNSTELTVEMYMAPEAIETMTEGWEKALQKLKEIAER